MPAYAIRRRPGEWKTVDVHRFGDKASRAAWFRVHDSRRSMPVKKNHPAVLTAVNRCSVEDWDGDNPFRVEWDRRWGDPPGYRLLYGE